MRASDERHQFSEHDLFPSFCCVVRVLNTTVETVCLYPTHTSVRPSLLKLRMHQEGGSNRSGPVIKPNLVSTQQERISAYSLIRLPPFSTALIAAESDFVLSDSHTKQFISFLPVVIKEPISTPCFSLRGIVSIPFCLALIGCLVVPRQELSKYNAGRVESCGIKGLTGCYSVLWHLGFGARLPGFSAMSSYVIAATRAWLNFIVEVSVMNSHGSIKMLANLKELLKLILKQHKSLKIVSLMIMD